MERSAREVSASTDNAYHGKIQSHSDLSQRHAPELLSSTVRTSGHGERHHHPREDHIS